MPSCEAHKGYAPTSIYTSLQQRALLMGRRYFAHTRSATQLIRGTDMTPLSNNRVHINTSISSLCGHLCSINKTWSLPFHPLAVSLCLSLPPALLRLDRVDLFSRMQAFRQTKLLQFLSGLQRINKTGIYSLPIGGSLYTRPCVDHAPCSSALQSCRVPAHTQKRSPVLLV